MDELTRKEVKELLHKDQEPCLTLLMPTEMIAGDAVEKMKIRFKNLLKEAEKKLDEVWGFEEDERSEFMEPLKDYLNDRNFWLNQSQGLVMFRSAEDFAFYRLPLDFTPQVRLEKHFYIIPLIPEIFSEKRFYLLAISRKNSRLFQGTPQEIEEVELEELPQGIEAIIDDEDRQSSTQQHSAARGGTSVIHHGHDDRDEKVSSELLRYLRETENALNQRLQDSDQPLLVMCVQELFPHIKQVFDYPHLLEDFVQGNPDRLSRQEIMEKARPVIEPHFKRPHQNIATEYREQRGSEKTSQDLDEIVPASHQGRIRTLMLTADGGREGIFNMDEDSIKTGVKPPEGYTLENYAAIRTFNTGGEIFLLQEEEMPVSSPICAIFRY